MEKAKMNIELTSSRGHYRVYDDEGREVFITNSVIYDAFHRKDHDEITDFGFSSQEELEGLLESLLSEEEEKEEMMAINPENKQKLCLQMIDLEDHDYEQARKELAITSQYHNWHNTIADRIYGLIDEDLGKTPPISLSLIEEYNEQVDAFNKYGDALGICQDMSMDDMAQTIKDNSNQVL